MTTIIDVPDLAGTEAFGRRLGQLLFRGAVVALAGPLGAGKTHLVRAIAEGLGVDDARLVNSPTFVLIQEYDARLPIYHFDAYRLHSEREFLDLGVQEYFAGDGVCLVEWADKVKDCLPGEHLWIEIVATGASSRRLIVTAKGIKYAETAELLTSKGKNMRKLAPEKQKRLDILMAKNNEGTLANSEQDDLRKLVHEAEEILLNNARRLSEQVTFTMQSNGTSPSR